MICDFVTTLNSKMDKKRKGKKKERGKSFVLMEHILFPLTLQR